MDKNLIWKSMLIVVVVALMGWNLYPPQETLKPGIDLAGGTSLIYEIDITGLAPKERKDLAQNMTPILLKRIDPTHVANIIMRPQGDTRIEIQLPVASKDTQNKRNAYEDALLELEKENINLLKIRQMLALEADERTGNLTPLRVMPQNAGRSLRHWPMPMTSESRRRTSGTFWSVKWTR
ncbi:MAG: hypothetical protein H8E62_05070 [Planctomycetes bacterium]|nr:hypothetical protein [Planctomycetota bacterium]